MTKWGETSDNGVRNIVCYYKNTLGFCVQSV